MGMGKHRGRLEGNDGAMYGGMVAQDAWVEAGRIDEGRYEECWRWREAHETNQVAMRQRCR